MKKQNNPKTLQDWYVEETGCTYLVGPCECCLTYLEPEKIKWSNDLKCYACPGCLKHEGKIKMIKTVGELIEILKTYPQEAVVRIESNYFDDALPLPLKECYKSSGEVIIRVYEADFVDDYIEEEDFKDGYIGNGLIKELSHVNPFK